MLQMSNANGDIFLSAPNGRIHFLSQYFSREVGSEGSAIQNRTAPAPAKPGPFDALTGALAITASTIAENASAMEKSAEHAVSNAAKLAHAAAQAEKAAVEQAAATLAGRSIMAEQASEKQALSGLDQEGGLLALLGAYKLGGPSQRALQEWIGKQQYVADQLPYDGAVIGAGCTSHKGASPTDVSGFRPQGKCQGKKLPKVLFVNGINTRLTNPQGGPAQEADGSPGGMCNTLQKIANQSCAEVVGIYNATEGAPADLKECVGIISKKLSVPPAVTLRDALVKAAESGQPLTIYAHSEGGLIAQEALDSAKNQLRNEGSDPVAALAIMQVKSYGTAESGWPIGPQYEHWNNDADPVPKAIAGAQLNYRAEILSDSDPTKTQCLNQPFLNPIDAHRFNDVYLQRLGPAPGDRECQC